MGIQKSFLKSFTANDLMRFIDYYAENNKVLLIPGHSRNQCDLLARFLGFGYDRTWAPQEVETLTAHYAQLGAEATAELLPLRTPMDCSKKAGHLGLHTVVRKRRVSQEHGPWMQWEYDILRKYYPIIGSKTAILLPDRSEAACVARATVEKIAIIKPALWTEEELEILKADYPQKGPEIEQLLKSKTRQNIVSKAMRMGISMLSQEWTPEEDELLKTYYPLMGAEASKFFEGRRSGSACTARANRLGIITEKNHVTWSQEELKILDRHYPSMGADVVELLPGRTRNSCRKMAKRRNLSCAACKGKRPETNRRWTDEERKILTEEFPKLGPDVYKLLPNRTRAACVNMAASLKLTRPGTSSWTEEEKEVLRTYYPQLGLDVTSLLPGRSRYACQSQARAMKLFVDNKNWTAEEDAVLTRYYPKEGPAAFRRLPQRTEFACRSRLSRLGISIPLAIEKSPPRKKRRRRVDPSMVKVYITAHPDATLKRIAEQFHCSCGTISLIKRELGMGRKKALHVDRNAVKALMEAHPKSTIEEIARALGCSQAAISRAKREMGLSRRKVADDLRPYIAEHPHDNANDIAELFNCSLTTVMNVKRGLGISRRRSKEIDLNTLRAYIVSRPQASTDEIAEELNCSYTKACLAKKQLKLLGATADETEVE